MSHPFNKNKKVIEEKGVSGPLMSQSSWTLSFHCHISEFLPVLFYFCCVMMSCPLVRMFAQTGICLTERHAPVVFTN